MTSNPITQEESDTFYDALAIFSKYEIKHLPITLNGKIS
jgi:signal-transduction protein with cAMP-binding, CBS, and nucleotidyltransferase domain